MKTIFRNLGKTLSEKKFTSFNNLVDLNPRLTMSSLGSFNEKSVTQKIQ